MFVSGCIYETTLQLSDLLARNKTSTVPLLGHKSYKMDY